MSSDNYFNATQAAKHSGVNVVTIRDYLAKGKLPNSKQVPKGKVKVWQIPLTDLVAAGLLDKASKASESATEAQAVEVRSTAFETEIRELRTEIRHLTDTLARTDKELAIYRDRELKLYFTLETKDVQEQRRSWWFGRNK
jgi:vacuolar-type H+-ATPase subunit I/STV1